MRTLKADLANAREDGEDLAELVHVERGEGRFAEGATSDVGRLRHLLGRFAELLLQEEQRFVVLAAHLEFRHVCVSGNIVVMDVYTEAS